MGKYKWLILGIVVCLVLIGTSFFIGKLSVKKELDLSRQNLIAMQDTVTKYKIKLDGLEQQVFEKDGVIVSLKDAIKIGLIEKEYWRKLQLTGLISNVKLEGIIAALEDSLKAKPATVFITVKDSTGVSSDYVKTPFTLLDIHTENLSLVAGMNKDRTAYYKIGVPIIGTLTVGYKKNKPVGIFVSENPLLDITNMNIVITPYESKWYNQWYITGTAGFLGGLLLGRLIK